MVAGNVYLDIHDGVTVKIDAEFASGYSSVWTVDRTVSTRTTRSSAE